MTDNWQPIVAVVVAILIAYAAVLWIGTIVWTYRDIRDRTRDGWSQTVAVGLVAIFSIPGLFLYLILRPHETLTEAYERRLEAEALLREMPDRNACPRCERPANEDYLLCPYCRTTLREPCLGCSRPLELAWTACPYCGAHGPQATVTATQPRPERASAASPPAPEPQPSGRAAQRPAAPQTGTGRPSR